MNTDPTEPTDDKRDAIINGAVELFRELLTEHIDRAAEDANDDFVGDDNQSEPVARLGFTLSFPTLTRSPEVILKVSWSVRRKAESSITVDDGQAKLPLETEASK